jgi:hypothetical protein
MHVIDNVTGREILPGQPLTSFRGEAAVLVAPERAAIPGKSGRVHVEWVSLDRNYRGWYYDMVFSVTVISDAEFNSPQNTVNRFIDAQ